MRDTILNLRSSEAEGVPKPKRAEGRRIWKSVGILIVALVVVSYLWSVIASGMTWRAIFLNNNQVYFGHFWDVPFASTITLTDVYYLEVAQPSEQLSGQDQSQLKLVKLGNEVHGPTSEMVIPIQQILFWETLRPDSAVVAAIKSLSN